MPFEDIFGISNLAAMLGWIILLLAPRRFRLSTLLPGIVIPLGLSLLYALLVLRFFVEAGGGYSSMAAVRTLLSNDGMLLAGWVHYLAFDLFVGTWLAQRMDQAAISRIVQAPILCLTFMFGPVGFLIGWSVIHGRTAWGAREVAQ